MSAIERCRTAALGGHVARCEDCDHTRIAYNSCRNRHCPKCQGAAAKEWLADRAAELLPVAYYHVVFTLPAPIADIAYQNKAEIYAILFRAAAETLLTIAADPRHLGARAASPPCSTPGALRSPITRTSTASCRAAASRSMARAGSRAGRASSCPCACSRGCSAGWSWSSWRRRMRPAASNSSATTRRSPSTMPSRPIWRHCARSSGSFMPSGRSPGQRRCWRICRATPTASPSPTAA
jgi:Transposase zinc-binding domain